MATSHHSAKCAMESPSSTSQNVSSTTCDPHLNSKKCRSACSPCAASTNAQMFFLFMFFKNVSFDTSFACSRNIHVCKPMRAPRHVVADKSPCIPRNRREAAIRPTMNGSSSKSLVPRNCRLISMLLPRVSRRVLPRVSRSGIPRASCCCWLVERLQFLRLLLYGGVAGKLADVIRIAFVDATDVL